MIKGIRADDAEVHAGTKKKSAQICVRVRPILYAKLRLFARQHHRTPSWVASALLEECMGLTELDETKTRLFVKGAALEPSARPSPEHHVKRVHGLLVIRTSDFVRYNVQGHFDFPASKQALTQVAHACHEHGITRELLDLRDMKVGEEPFFTPEDLDLLVHAFPEMGFTKKDWLAVLFVADPHHRARLFASVSKRHGWHVEAFDNYEAANTWLNKEPTKAHDTGS